MDKKNLIYSNFKELCNAILDMSCEEIILQHINLKGKNYITEDKVILDYYYNEYIKAILNFDYGYSIVRRETEELHKFINSKYLSDYFKQMIKEKLEGMDNCDIALSAVNSNREISSFTEEEFNSIYKSLQNLVFLYRKPDFLYKLILPLALKLDSKGTNEFLNNKVDPKIVIKQIVSTSGMDENPAYYSGRKATFADLNGEILLEIFRKLEKLDKKKALAMVKMTLEMPTLGATAFLNSLYNLAANGYNFSKDIIIENNIDFGNPKRNSTIAAGLGTMMGQLNLGDYTEDIKNQFKNLLVDFLEKRKKYMENETIHKKG